MDGTTYLYGYKRGGGRVVTYTLLLGPRVAKGRPFTIVGLVPDPTSRGLRCVVHREPSTGELVKQGLLVTGGPEGKLGLV